MPSSDMAAMAASIWSASWVFDFFVATPYSCGANCASKSMVESST